MLIQSNAAEALIGTHETVIAAKKLVPLKGVSIDKSCKPIDYVHFLLDQHELVVAEGAWSESLFIGKQVWTHIDREAKEELSLIMGIKTEDDVPDLTPARQIPSPRLQRDIVSAIRQTAD